MEILGIGPMELILVLIIATVVFGPDKLPEIGAKLGQGLKALRGVTREFTRETQDLREAVTAPVREIQQPLKEMVDPVREELAGLAPMAQAVTNPQEALRQAVAREMTAATAPAIAAVEAAASAASLTPVEAPRTTMATLEAPGETAAAQVADTTQIAALAAEPAALALPAPRTPQEALRRAVARELAQTQAPPAASFDELARQALAGSGEPSAAAANQGVPDSAQAELAVRDETAVVARGASAGAGSEQPAAGLEQPAEPVPFVGTPQPGLSPAQAPAGNLNGTGGAGEAPAEPAAAVEEHAAAAPAAGVENEPAPQRVVRLKPRRLNRPYFGKNVSKP